MLGVIGVYMGSYYNVSRRPWQSVTFTTELKEVA